MSPYSKSESFSKLNDKLSFTVRDDGEQHTMQGDNLIQNKS
jgi:hypothetical protein